MRKRGSIRQRGTYWEVSIPDGKGGRNYDYAHTQREANQILTRMLREADTQARTDAHGLTLGEYLVAWLDDHGRELSPQTVRGYRRTIEVHLIPSLGKHPLDRIPPEAIREHFRKARSVVRPGRDAPLSETTLLQHYRILHTALKMAVEDQMIPHNPAEYVRPPKRERRCGRVMALSPEQAVLLLEMAVGHALYVPIALAIYCGLRRGEVFGLRWSDMDLDAGVLRVEQTLDYEAATPRFGPPKTETSVGAVQMPGALVAILREHQEAQEAVKGRVAEAYMDHGLVCCLEDGRPVCHAVNAAFDRILDQRLCPECGKPVVQRNSKAPFWVCRKVYGGCEARFALDDTRMKEPALPRIRFHDLRHTHGTLLNAAGVDTKTISTRLRHASTQFTADTYVHTLSEQERDAARRIGKLLGG